jgi:hypothetical protein
MAIFLWVDAIHIKGDISMTIRKPSHLPYKLKNPTLPSWSQKHQYDKCILKMLGNSRPDDNLFFVESGAYDGESMSTSLALEMHGSWSGLLIEPNPALFSNIVNLNRKCYAINAGLSITNASGMMEFVMAGARGGFTSTLRTSKTQQYQQRNSRPTRSLRSKSENSGLHIKVPVHPLETMLLATGNTKLVVDFWSLDTEGSEADILSVIDFSRITIGYLLVEHNDDPTSKSRILQVMAQTGMIVIDGHGTQDFEFYNPKYFEKMNLPIPNKSC